MNRRMYILIVLMLAVIPITVFAAQQKGSIQLTMRHSSETVSGGTVTLYCVTDLSGAEDPQALAEYARYMGIPGTTRPVGTDGKVTFSDLEPGYYLLVQEEAAAGYRRMNPFCVSVPMAVGEELLYDIGAAPKLERIPEENLPQTGQLIWPIWILLGGGLGLIGMGLLLQKRQ